MIIIATRLVQFKDNTVPSVGTYFGDKDECKGEGLVEFVNFIKQRVKQNSFERLHIYSSYIISISVV